MSGCPSQISCLIQTHTHSSQGEGGTSRRIRDCELNIAQISAMLIRPSGRGLACQPVGWAFLCFLFPSLQPSISFLITSFLSTRKKTLSPFLWSHSRQDWVSNLPLFIQFYICNLPYFYSSLFIKNRLGVMPNFL